MNITQMFKNFGSNKLTGGTYFIAGTLSFANADVVTNASTMTLRGAAAQILNSNNNTNAFQNFASNRSPLSLTLGPAHFPICWTNGLRPFEASPLHSDTDSHGPTRWLAEQTKTHPDSGCPAPARCSKP